MTPTLPCYSCPHKSACCQHGVSLTEREASRVFDHFGLKYAYYDHGEQGYRTEVRGGACVFLKDNACRLHDEDFFPEVCAGYPFWQGRTEAPYASEVDDCPEFLRPELARLVDPQTKRLKVLR